MTASNTLIQDQPITPTIPASKAFTRTDKRKQYIIDKKTQSRFVLDLTVLLLIGGLLELGFAYVFWNLRDSLTLDTGRIATEPLLYILPWAYVLLVLFTNILVFVVLGMVYYHRIAGPVVNIVQSLERIANGDLSTRVHLRKGDHLGAVATAVNDLAAQWEAAGTPPDAATGERRNQDRPRAESKPE